MAAQSLDQASGVLDGVVALPALEEVVVVVGVRDMMGRRGGLGVVVVLAAFGHPSLEGAC